MTRRTTVTAEFDVVHGDDAATVRKLLTPRGQLVEIESAGGNEPAGGNESAGGSESAGDERNASTVDRPGSSNAIRIDALGLESLSWQTEAELAERLGWQPPTDRDVTDDAHEVDGSFDVSNEYADVEIAKTTSAGGDALVVRAPVKRTELRLHPALVGALATRDTDLFSEFLETPHGPHDH
ncbi:hypothetical protein [Halopenitus persicus]|uniref:hypothetical protein n=1 Tax=Halopenitus persicus TaxID=1048396 RepID=UPI000BBAC8AF|nr:hypothetical protein [Halopenitus persicus]